MGLNMETEIAAAVIFGRSSYMATLVLTRAILESSLQLIDTWTQSSPPAIWHKRCELRPCNYLDGDTA